MGDIQFKTNHRRAASVDIAGRAVDGVAWCEHCGDWDRPMLSFDVAGGGEVSPRRLCEKCLRGFFRYLETHTVGAYRSAPEGVKR